MGFLKAIHRASNMLALYWVCCCGILSMEASAISFGTGSVYLHGENSSGVQDKPLGFDFHSYNNRGALNMIDKNQLRELVVVPTLMDMHEKAQLPYSEEAVDLLMGTAAAESNMGSYIAQKGGGPALGIFQMEPPTEQDIWDNYLKYNDTLRMYVIQSHGQPGAEELIWNLRYGVVMARLHYYRVADPLPSKDNFRTNADYVGALAAYWKQHYNTPDGAGTHKHFLNSYYRFFAEEMS